MSIILDWSMRRGQALYRITVDRVIINHFRPMRREMADPSVSFGPILYKLTHQYLFS